MPTINAKFNADFSSFYAAVERADVEVRGFNDSAATVSKSLSRMVDSFSGRKIIEDATLMAQAIEGVGGASALTEKELARANKTISEASDKLRAMGQEVPAGFTAITEAAGPAADATDNVAVSFGNLVKAHLTAEAVMKLVEEAWHALVDVVHEAIDAANEADKTDVRLNAALQNQGTNVESVTKAYDEYAKTVSTSTGFQKDALKQTEATLALVGNVMPQDMEKALRATADLAVGLGKDLPDAAMMVAKAAEGQTTALKRAGLVIDQTAAQAGGFNNVLDQINARVGGQGAAFMETYAGHVKGLGNAYHELLEEGGKVVTHNATLSTAIGLVTKALTDETSGAGLAKAANELLSEAVIFVAKSVSLGLGAFDLLQQTYHNLQYASDEVAATILQLGKAVLDTATAIGTYTKYVNPVAWTQTWKTGMKEIADTSAVLGGAIDGLNKHQAEVAGTSAAWSAGVGKLQTDLNAAVNTLESTRGKTIEVGKATGDATDAWDRQTKSVNNNKKAHDAWAEATKDVLGFATPYLEVLNEINGAVLEGARYYLQNGAEAAKVAKMYELTDAQIKAITRSMKDEIDILKVMDEIHAKTTNLAAEREKKRRAEMEATKQKLDEVLATYIKTAGEYEKKLDELANNSAADKINRDWAAALNKLGPPIAGFEESWKRAVDDIDAYFSAKMAQEDWANAVKRAGEDAGSGFTAALQSQLTGVPDMLMKAFQGGGGLTGGIKSLAAGIGGDLGKSIAQGPAGQKVAEGIGSMLGVSTAAGAGKVAGMVGGIMSGVMSMGISTAAGFAIQGVQALWNKFVNSPEKQINPIREAFVQAAGGLGELNKKAVEAGTNLDALLGAKNADQYKAAVEALNAAFKMSDARKSFIDAAGGLDQLTQKAWQAGTSVQALMSAKSGDELNAALQGLNDKFAFQQQALTDVVATAQKYGITLAQLGPALQKQELDKQAQQLYHDFETLNAAGVDSQAVIDGMSKSVNDYVHSALRMGAEIPAAMQPMLQKMADAGELTDENGNKIEDVTKSGIAWSMTMTEGFNKMIASVKELTTVISRSLGLALDDTKTKIDTMPKSIDVDVNYHAQGDLPKTDQNVPGYQTGTDGRFVDFGAGSLVMLHGKEAVVPLEQGPGPGTALRESDLAPTAAATTVLNITINAQGAFFDTPGDLQRLADKVNEALTARYGLQHRMRAA